MRKKAKRGRGRPTGIDTIVARRWVYRQAKTIWAQRRDVSAVYVAGVLEGRMRTERPGKFYSWHTIYNLIKGNRWHIYHPPKELR